MVSFHRCSFIVRRKGNLYFTRESICVRVCSCSQVRWEVEMKAEEDEFEQQQHVARQERGGGRTASVASQESFSSWQEI